MTSPLPMRATRLAFTALAASALAGCGINSVPTAEENAKAKWGDVQAAFQERANLIPNSNLLDTLAHRVHGLPVVRIPAGLHLVQLMAGLSPGRQREGAQVFQRTAPKLDRFGISHITSIQRFV